MLLFDKYKKFWEEGDIEAFTSIIHADIEIITHSTSGVIDSIFGWNEFRQLCFQMHMRKILDASMKMTILWLFIRLLTQQMEVEMLLCTCLQKKMEC